MPRKTMLLIALVLCLPALSPAAAPAVPRIAWTVETSAPVARRLDLRYGETVDLECRFLSYNTSMDILGGAVVLHARTNGMAEGGSFQYAGAAGSNGLATVRLPVDSWLPQGLTNASWTLECVQTNAVRLLRASGSVTLSGTSATSTNDPLPTVWLTNITAQIAAATGSLSQASSAALGVVSQSVASVAAGLASVSQSVASVSSRVSSLSNSFDSVAALALTNRVLRLHDGAAASPRWLMLSGSNLLVRAEAVTNAWHFEGVYDVLPLTHPLSLYSGGGWSVTGIAEGSPADITFLLSGVTWQIPGVEINSTNFIMSAYSSELDSLVYTNLFYGPLPVTNTVMTLSLDLVAELVRLGVWDAISGALSAGTNAQAAADDAMIAAGLAQGDISGHAPAGTIAAPHLILGDRDLIDSVPGKVSANGGTLTNGYIAGTLTFLNTQPTNLVGRLFATNNVLLIEWSAQ